MRGAQPEITQGELIWIADAHRDDGKRFVVHADEKLTAFLELQSTTRQLNPLGESCNKLSGDSPSVVEFGCARVT